MFSTRSYDAILQAGLRTLDRPSPFQPEAEASLTHFRALRTELEIRVKSGDLTPKVAREQADTAFRQLRDDLSARSQNYSATSPVFLDRLVAASQDRRKARETMSLEGLQRETNRLLRLSLIEGQLQTRGAEFEARTFLRPVTGGAPAPTLDSLLAFHRTAEQAGDEAALEWSRRHLEGFRSRVTEESEVRRIDLACDRPDRINPRLVEAYVSSMSGRGVDELETFVERAIGDADANACVAAFVLARQDTTQGGARWVRRVLSGLTEYPDTALNTLRELEAGARASDSEAARSHAELAIARAQAEARMDGLEAPTSADLERLARVANLPMARPTTFGDDQTSPAEHDIAFIG